MGEAAGVPEEFFAHHGNLSKEHREDAERRMKDRSRPASIVCTTTLELGIDVGDIEMVAQLGPGHSVSGMRQRLGRSGRRPGQSAVMRVYVTEMELADSLHPMDALRAATIQTIAMLRLMRRGWNEPSIASQLNLSTLLHQIMALIGQHGGATAAQIRDVLLKSGTFSSVDISMMVKLLRRMGDPEVGLLEQAADGLLLPGPAGERLLESRDIFSVFMSPEEYNVVTDAGRMVGKIPGDNPLTPGGLLMLAGRRWKILEVDSKRRELSVRPASGGKPPIFGGEPRLPAEGVVKEMRAVWEDFDIPPYLDPVAKELLVQGRITYDRLGLRNSSIARHDGQLLLFPWVGEHRSKALAVALISAGLAPEVLGVAISLPGHQEAQLVAALAELANGSPPDPAVLAALVANKAVDKFDPLVGSDLLTAVWVKDRLDIANLPTTAAGLLDQLGVNRGSPA
jgi:ATP-dependent helicase Lhr and Lhr-like helicase